jgi:hypothetical protein
MSKEIENKKEEINGVLDELSQEKHNFNIEILEQIVGLEKRFKTISLSSGEMISSLENIKKEKDEWQKAFYFLVDKIYQFAEMDSVNTDVVSQLKELNEMIDQPYHVIPSSQKQEEEDSSNFSDDNILEEDDSNNDDSKTSFSEESVGLLADKEDVGNKPNNLEPLIAKR